MRKLQGKEVEISIKELKPDRSNQQNRYYWGVVLKYISLDTGYTTEEANIVFKQMFLKADREFKQIGDIVPTGTTTELSTSEMEDYMRKIRDFASQELSIYIPLPNDNYE